MNKKKLSTTIHFFKTLILHTTALRKKKTRDCDNVFSFQLIVFNFQNNNGFIISSLDNSKY